MGRKRKDDNEKSISVNISIKRKYWNELKRRGSPSIIISKLVKNFLENDNKKGLK